MTQLGTKKSRKGCRRCKQRRVKCDEHAPCGNCVRRSEECSLLEPTPSGSSSSNLDGVGESGFPMSREEWIQDLELLHHYTGNASMACLNARARMQALWRDYIPKQALRYTYLMHGLLALSALHLAYINRDEADIRGRYLTLADKHQGIAVTELRNELSHTLEPESADALFALASVISVSSMARSCAVPAVMEVPGALSVDDIAELLILTKGIRDIIGQTYEYIKQGPMTGIFENNTIPEGQVVKLPQSVAQLFLDLGQMLDAYGLDPDSTKHCRAALDDLEEIYRTIVYWGGIANIETGQVYRWQTMVTPEYVRLLQGRCPPAMIIAAHYAAATTAVRRAWFSKNWAEFAIRGISHELPADMQRWVEWPLQQSELRMEVLGIGVEVVQAERPSSPRPMIGF